MKIHKYFLGKTILKYSKNLNFIMTITIFCIILFGLASCIPSFAETTASDEIKTEATESDLLNKFIDIDETYWAAPQLIWGVNDLGITGYPDQTFGPEKTLSEAEFAVLLTKYAKDISIPAPISTQFHWSQKYYDALQKYDLPFIGYQNDSVKDASITRSRVAMIVAGYLGFNLTEEQAVYFMYENELSVGLEAGKRSYSSYGPEKQLTRAQAITFFHNMAQNSNKIITFKGAKSNKINAFYRNIIGIVGIEKNTALVDFHDFDSIAEKEKNELLMKTSDIYIPFKVLPYGGSGFIQIGVYDYQTKKLLHEETKEISYFNNNKPENAFIFNNEDVKSNRYLIKLIKEYTSSKDGIFHQYHSYYRIGEELGEVELCSPSFSSPNPHMEKYDIDVSAKKNVYNFELTYDAFTCYSNDPKTPTPDADDRRVIEFNLYQLDEETPLPVEKMISRISTSINRIDNITQSWPYADSQDWWADENSFKLLDENLMPYYYYSRECEISSYSYSLNENNNIGDIELEFSVKYFYGTVEDYKLVLDSRLLKDIRYVNLKDGEIEVVISDRNEKIRIHKIAKADYYTATEWEAMTGEKISNYENSNFEDWWKDLHTIGSEENEYEFSEGTAYMADLYLRTEEYNRH